MRTFLSLASSCVAVFTVLVGFAPAASAQVAPPQVRLSSVVIVGTDTVTVNYSKNFGTCAHLKLASNNQLVHTQNLFCANTGPVVSLKTQFTSALQSGARVKLCHGNNGNICSAVVTVQSQPAAVTLTSVIIDRDTVKVQYSKNFATCAVLKLSNGQPLHTLSLFCAQGGTLTLPKSYFNASLVGGAQVKMCHAVNPVCSSLVIVQGGVTDQVTLSNVVINGSNVTVNYTKNFATCAHLMLSANNQLLHVQNLFCANSGPVTQPRTQFTNALVAGAKVKLCHGNNYGVCSAVVTVTEQSSPVENELTVTVKSLASTDVAVKNEKNINLLRFEARSTNEEVLVTSFVFDAQAGNLLNAQNYKLWVDTNADGTVDTILQGGVVAQSGKVTFAQLLGGGYVVPSGGTVLFEVHADVAASLSTPASVQLKFATAQVDYVKAERVTNGDDFVGIKTDGVCATTCTITVNTVPSTSWNFVSQGDLFITKSATPQRNLQLLGGALGDSILNLNFRAQNEPVDVTFLTIVTGGDVSMSVDRYEFYKTGESIPFASATRAGCGSGGQGNNVFCVSMQSRQLVVPDGQTVSVFVKPRIRTDVDGAVSGHVVDPQILDLTGVDDVTARGDASSNNLLTNDNDALAEGEVFLGVSSPAANAPIIGKVNSVVLAKISNISNANPDANGTSVPTGIGRGFAQFKFSTLANANSKNGLNKFALSGVILNVNATNVAMDAAAFKFYNKADSTTKVVCKPINAVGTVLTGTVTGTFFVSCTGLQFSALNADVTSGSDETFVLEGAITNSRISSTSSSVLQGSLQNFTDQAATSFSPATSHVQWVDKDAAFPLQNFRWIDFTETVVNSTAYQD